MVKMIFKFIYIYLYIMFIAGFPQNVAQLSADWQQLSSRRLAAVQSRGPISTLLKTMLCGNC